MADRVFIFDTTLRDGEQSPGFSMWPDEKLEMARQLARLGVDVIEAGFPISSPGEFEGVRGIAARVRGPVICGLARANPKDVEAAAEAVRPAERARVHTFIATSPIHMARKLRMSPARVLPSSTSPIPLATRCRRSLARWCGHCASVCRAWTALPSASTATTTLVSPPPTPWRV